MQRIWCTGGFFSVNFEPGELHLLENIGVCLPSFFLTNQTSDLTISTVTPFLLKIQLEILTLLKWQFYQEKKVLHTAGFVIRCCAESLALSLKSSCIVTWLQCEFKEKNMTFPAGSNGKSM